MSSIWNPQDRYILANGAVSANAPLSGDGSNSQPLGLDLKTDNSLSGNGTLTSPLGVVNTWQDVTSGFNVANISNDSRMTFLYNDTLKVLSWTFKFKPNNGSYGNTAYAVCTIPEQYRPYGLFELSNADGTNFCDYYSANGTVIPRNSSGYFSQSMVWPVKSAVI